MVSAMLFGRACGVLATLLSAALAAYFFLAPVHSFAINSPNGALSLGLFMLTGLVIAVLASALRNAYRDAEAMRRQTEVAHAQAERDRARAEAGERERQLLLVEFGHRVKNDMQRITSNLHLQAAHLGPGAAAALQQAANQVRVIAAMHDRLAQRDGQVLVDMGEFLRDLGEGLRATMAGTRLVQLVVEAENHTLPIDRAGSVGLIANELVTNALKHAFPDGRAGSVSIRFRRKEPDFLMTVMDDGVGLPDTPPDASPSRRQGLGRKLTGALAVQLRGAIEVTRGEPVGTAYTLRFPVIQSDLT
jgi:two-component sensor histidine kinase